MKDVAEYTFKIEGFTPKNMPFGRLVKYYAEIKRMLGDSENLHLTALFEGSHGSAFAVDPDYQDAFDDRLRQISQGSAPKAVTHAQSTINEMLKEDGTSGRFCDSVGKNVIVFPGESLGRDASFKVRDSANFVGELYHIAGNHGDVKVRISTDTYGVVFCTTTRNIAKALRDFLFENVKVSGRGVWSRDINGEWNISDFVITDFAPIKQENLRVTIDKIRRLDIKWPKDVLDEIATFEETDEGTQ